MVNFCMGKTYDLSFINIRKSTIQLLEMIYCIQPLLINEILHTTTAHMGGLAIMVISPTNWEFLPFFMFPLWIIQPHVKSFNDFM